MKPKEEKRYLRTESDTDLVVNARYREFVEMYAQDQELFFKDYAEAHTKLGAMGQEHNLMCEIEDAQKANELISEKSGVDV